MQSDEIRKRFLTFFESKGHKVVPSSPLVTDDPSVLFTTAGMQQFKPYYTGAKDPMVDFGLKNTVSVQKCVRTSDIDEVGDDTHLTFFEMLGNFSFGGYWKKEAIKYAHEFITEELGLTIDYVSVFEGDSETPADSESREIWKAVDPNLTIKDHSRADNFWGPTGTEGPCGPTTEIYINGVEIWNIVFNEYYKTKDGKYEPLKIKGIDTGMGLERLLVQVQKKVSVFETDILGKIIGSVEADGERSKRIVADHIRTAVFMIADGVLPSNTDRGYVLRRLIRRATRYSENLGSVIDAVNDAYRKVYELGNEKYIRGAILEEEDRFRKTLAEGLKKFVRIKTLNGVPIDKIKIINGVPIENIKEYNGVPIEKKLNGKDIFTLYSTYGFPIELTRELAKEKGLLIDEEDFQEESKKHQELSRLGSEQKFKGGLAGHGDMEIKYHTATHLLQQALRDVLGIEVGQKGSNITSERLRFDFTFPRRMTDEERQKVEDIVNEKINEALPVNKIILPREEAENTSALHFFGDKYGEEISIYYIGTDLATAYSKEFCGGPHVKNTSELGKFKIQKEEAVSAGVRRIKAVLE